jgi:hypothetical protein
LLVGFSPLCMRAALSLLGLLGLLAVLGSLLGFSET